MARRLKTHLRVNLGAPVSEIDRARCGRYVSRRRLLGVKAVSRWRSLVELGLACLDCQRESRALIAELVGSDARPAR